MKLYLLTKSTFFIEEDKILSALFNEGLDMLHIRKPDTEPVYSERLLTLLPDDCRKQIVVHQHLYLKDEFGLKGVHLSPDSQSLPTFYRGTRSTTCHTLRELEQLRGKYDYIFLSPIKNYISEPQDTPCLDIEELRMAARKGLIGKNVFAFGGITLEDIPEMKDLGFGGVAILGDIWQRFSPQTSTNYKELIHHFRKLRKAVN